ncbi:amino acid permease [Paraburkholderia ginsengiterrae]|uniref:Amino acid permease n=1 Tax=Paraburkholderia ginsengiterrae TaxID=1462993 RepID=A0A1A9NDD2_9BURK|nr:amino acid permease [Paraburkholderia ginsengiterrae]OAJ51579.1 amino acid permease [Paraburkholderia ginsengiterrae]OAJ64593.1 amino acid permease [Paraburkholderia ginsengiterrae]
MDINTAVPSAESADNDVKLLHKMGYAQELSRRMGAFSNFAVSFSLICILSGGITSFQMGLSAAGGASIGLGWPLGSLFALVVAAAMAQIASSYPTAGGLYHWSSILGGKTWGWLTAWLNLLGLVFVVAAINFGTYDPFFRTLIAPMFGVNPDSLGWWQQTLFLTVITASQAFLNHRGIRITSKITDLSGYLIFVVTVMLVVSLLVYSPVKIDLSRLYTFTNFTGVDGGQWPKQTMAMAFLSGLLLTAYTITGFDASAHTSEETHEAARNVPRGIIGSVFWSTTFGYVMVCAFVLVMPDITAAVKQGTGFFEAILAPIPAPLRIVIELLMFFINYVCGLAAVTSTSRMMFAFARDGGLPASKWLRKVNAAHRTPGAAIWTCAVLAIAVTLYGDAFTVLSAGSAVFLFISYAMPTAAGIFAEGRTWTEKGPFQLGMWSKPFAVAAVFGALVLAYVGMQPPNQKVTYVIIGLLVVLLAIWYGAGVRNSFAGPPIGKLSKERESELRGMEGQLEES